jgi:hypothetical protein
MFTIGKFPQKRETYKNKIKFKNTNFMLRANALAHVPQMKKHWMPM